MTAGLYSGFFFFLDVDFFFVEMQRRHLITETAGVRQREAGVKREATPNADRYGLGTRSSCGCLFFKILLSMEKAENDSKSTQKDGGKHDR